MPRVLVVGCGLIGTSVALALRARGRDEVLLHDTEPAHLAVAVERGAGQPWDGRATVDVAVVAVSPRHTAQVLAALQQLDIALTYTHTASFQSQVQREVEALARDPSVVVGGHPLAGRETSGPSGASSELFVGRPWAVCPGSGSREQAVAVVTDLARAVGAEPLLLSAEAHDQAVALLSHLPQVAASGLAAVVATAGASTDVRLSGTGLADTTRLAASSPALWADILEGNAPHVAPLVRRLTAVLDRLASDLEALPSEAARNGVVSLLREGNAGRALVPVKRGVSDEGFGAVPVDVDDRPGQLAALLTAAADLGVNVEDVRVDHVPGRPTGVISLVVQRDAVAVLREGLAARGWRVQGFPDHSAP